MWKKIKYVNDENEGRIKHSKVVVKIKKTKHLGFFVSVFASSIEDGYQRNSVHSLPYFVAADD